MTISDNHRQKCQQNFEAAGCPVLSRCCSDHRRE